MAYYVNKTVKFITFSNVFRCGLKFYADYLNKKNVYEC